MKKIALVLICGFLLSSMSVNAAQNVNVFLNGKALTFDQAPMIQNDCTFVPVRQIFESFGMEVDWDEENQCVYAYNDNTEISMSIGSDEMWVNGKCIQLDAVPFLNCGSAFVPIRVISEALDCNVEWNGATGSVIIAGNGNAAAPTQAPIYTSAPTSEPTEKPTTAPTSEPTVRPTVKPTAAPTVTPTAKPTAAPSTTEAAMEKEVLALVNKVRAENGLSALTWADDLANVARAHSRDMINRNFFSHTNPDGLSPFDRLKNSGISYKTAAENIAYGQKTAEAVMNSWMNSSGHRANILNKNVKEIGIGAVKNSSGTIYWTQVFVAR